MKWILLSWMFLATQSEHSRINQEIKFSETGKAVKIVDGDTFDFLGKNNRLSRVRLYGIDSPERRQDYYQAAKNALAGFILHQHVTLQTTGRDRNGRLIAIAYCRGENINLAMIRGGYAWHFKKYSRDAGWAAAEEKARKLGKGLWRGAHPIAPWDFRQIRRKGISRQVVP